MILKNLKNKIKTSPCAGEVGAPLRVRGTREQTVGIYLRLFSSAHNVILRRERSELSGESRTFMAILLKVGNSIAYRFFTPVILGLVPRILVQQVTNLVNKLALLFKRSMLSQDCRNGLCVTSGNDGKRQRLSVCYQFFKRIYHPGCSANELTLKAKDDYKSMLQSGRSMIEMLGVLAIIAVLSVGGIAGYSKAMEMWKISRQKEQLAEFFLQCVNLKDDFLREYNTTKKAVPTADIMDAMGVIPDGMKKAGLYHVKDFADNLIYVYFTESKWSDEAGIKYSALEYLLIFDIFSAEKSSRLKQQYCVTFLEQAQAVSPYIRQVQSRGSDDSFGGYNAKTIKIGSAKPNEIHDFCKKCNSDRACQLVLYFKL